MTDCVAVERADPPWRSVKHALTARHLAQLAQASHSALADVGRVRGAPDPQACITTIADVALLMRACTDAERLALGVEIAHPDLPVETPRRVVGPAPRGYRRRSRLSRCALLSHALREAVGERRYYDLVADGWDKVRAALVAVTP